MGRVFDLNLVGLIVMAAAVILVILAGRIAGRFPEKKRESVKIGLKFAGMGICIAGFLIAMYL